MKNKLPKLAKLFLSLTLISLAPLVYYFKLTHYPITHIESWMLILAVLGINFVFSLLILISKFWLKLILLTLFIVSNLSFLPTINTVGILLILLLALPLFYIFLDKKIFILTDTMAAAFILSILILPIGAETDSATIEMPKHHEPDKSLPTVLHILFDAHNGLSQTAGLEQKLLAFYKKYDFRVYPNGFSHYHNTFETMPNLFNFSNHNTVDFYHLGSMNSHNMLVTKNQYFTKLSKIGYQFKIYQSDYLNYCRTPNVNYAYCYTYPVHNMTAFSKMPLSVSDKVTFISFDYLLKSSVYRYLTGNYNEKLRPLLARYLNIDLPQNPWTLSNIASLSGVQVLQKVMEDIHQQPQGTVYFAHVLLPHGAYIYDKDCHIVKNIDSWRPEFSYASISEKKYQELYSRYYSQMTCLYKTLDKQLANIKQDPQLKNIKIILHGDHGSRISRQPTVSGNQKNLSWQDILDSYSTLIAIHTNGAAPGQNLIQVSLDQVFKQFYLTLLGQDYKEQFVEENYVFLVTTKRGTPFIKLPFSYFKTGKSNGSTQSSSNGQS